MSNPSSQVQAILDRVKAAAASKQAADTGGVTDPTDRGTATAPTDPAIVGLPPNKPMTGPVPADDQTLKPGGTGTAVPTTESQNSKDDAAKSPTDDLSKIATGADAMKNKLAAILAAAQGKQAAAPAATAPAATTAAPAATGAEPGKAASEASPFAQETLAKLAHLALQTEDGQAFMTQLVERELGQKEAASLINEAVAAHLAFGKSASVAEAQAYASWQQQEQEKAAFIQQQANAEAEVQALYAAATPAEQAELRKIASIYDWADKNLQHPALKAAFAAGVQDAATDADTMEAGGEMPTGEEEPSAEDIQMLIQQAVEEGKLPPEVAMQLMDRLAQGAAPDGGTGNEGELDAEMTAAASLVA